MGEIHFYSKKSLLAWINESFEESKPADYCAQCGRFLEGVRRWRIELCDVCEPAQTREKLSSSESIEVSEEQPITGLPEDELTDELINEIEPQLVLDD